MAVIVPELTVKLDTAPKVIDPVEIEFVEIAPVVSDVVRIEPVVRTFADIKFALRLFINTEPAEIRDALKFINLAFEPVYTSE